MAVHGMADVRVIDGAAEIKFVKSPHGKAFLRLRFDDGVDIDITLNLAAMIGGVAKGVIERFGYDK